MRSTIRSWPSKRSPLLGPTQRSPRNRRTPSTCRRTSSRDSGSGRIRSRRTWRRPRRDASSSHAGTLARLPWTRFTPSTTSNTPPCRWATKRLPARPWWRLRQRGHSTTRRLPRVTRWRRFPRALPWSGETGRRRRVWNRHPLNCPGRVSPTLMRLRTLPGRSARRVRASPAAPRPRCASSRRYTPGCRSRPLPAPMTGPGRWIRRGWRRRRGSSTPRDGMTLPWGRRRPRPNSKR